MKRVLILNHSAQIGGAEMILLDVASHLGAPHSGAPDFGRPDRGKRCEVVLFADGPFRTALERAGVPVTVLAAGSGMMGVTREAARLRALASVPAVALQVGRLVRLARPFDVLYANSQKAAVIGMLAAGVLRKPIVWHMHDILSPEHFAGLQRRLTVRLANRLRARVIVISEAARRSWIASGGDPERVRVVPNGIRASLYAAAGGDPPALRATIVGGVGGGRVGGGGARTLVGLFGRISPWKGQDVLVDAVSRLPDIDAAIVGDALFGETAFRDRLAARIASPDLAGRVHLLGHRSDVPALLQAVDIVVHCSTAPEPFGRVIVEAMLAGRPVIASADGASAEILGAGYPFLVTPNDAAALADAIVRLRDLPAAERDRLVADNAARARDRFTVERMTDGIDRVLDGIAA